MPPRHRTRSPAHPPFVVLHVGDLHLMQRRARNDLDFRAILAQIAGQTHGRYDFVYLPGDLAEDAAAAAYAKLTRLLRTHPQMPVRLIPGDHDRQYGTMTAFESFYRQVMPAAAFRGKTIVPGVPPVVNRLDRPPTGPTPPWPAAPVPQYYFREDFGAVRCIFLDMISAGFGRKGIGLDFRLGNPQWEWLTREVRQARMDDKTCAVFMHAYPDDLREAEEKAAVAGLFWSERVRLVEMGHTHYNEIAHDGRTTYAAARSVGQNEDGSVGYAVVAIDRGTVSWRFKALDRTWPFVLITSPADRRISTEGLIPNLNGRIAVRALVLSDHAPTCRCRVDDGPWEPMTAQGGGIHVAQPRWPAGSRRITVEAFDARWCGHGPDFIDADVIEPAGRDFQPPAPPAKPGSDAFRVGAWIDKGVRGDQLGPNRVGRKW